MHRTFDRRALLQGSLALGAALMLPVARACEIVTSTLRITHPWTRATEPGATTAVLGMRLDEVVDDDRLILVETPVAEGADIGGPQARPVVDLPILRGQDIILDESGVHVRLIGLRFPLQVGRSYPLRLGFERSGVYLATLSVDYGRFR